MHRLMTLLRIMITAVGGIVVLALPALAHHGWGGYKTDVDMQISIVELKLGNPHDRLIAVDTEGVRWNLLLAPPARNRRFGFDESSVAVGDELRLFGSKHPRKNEIKVHCLFRGGESIYTYRYNNGRSSLARRGREERC